MALNDIVQSLIIILDILLVLTEGGMVIKMRPSFIPKRPRPFHMMTPNVECETIQVHRLESGGCNPGTVPIRRMSQEDYARAHTDFSSYRSQLRPGNHLAILQTKSSPSPPTYYGVGANISLWNPQVKENQYSAGQITITNGVDSLQAGWMVYPTMYKDNKTHMFIHTMVGGSHCYNTQCPGFVQVHKQLAVDSIIEWEPRHQGLPQAALNFVIYRDPPTGHWWLLVTNDYTPIGFWPNNIFNDMTKFGTYVSCGGETYSPADQPSNYPPMGNGAFPMGDPILDAYAKDFAIIVNDKNVLEDARDMERFMDSKKYYIRDLGFDTKWGHILCFGGYGG